MSAKVLKRTAQDQIVKIVIKCLDFAAVRYRIHLTRDHETPYINHAVAVAKIITEEANITDLSIIQAALLHGVIRLSAASSEEIEERFGPHVKNIVNNLPNPDSFLIKLKSLFRSDESLKPQALSYETRIVALAELLSNLRDEKERNYQSWETNKPNAYIMKIKSHVDGLYGTNTILEDKLQELFRQKGL